MGGSSEIKAVCRKFFYLWAFLITSIRKNNIELKFRHLMHNVVFVHVVEIVRKIKK